MHLIARQERTHPILSSGMRRQSNSLNPSASLGLSCPHPADKRITVLVRHLDVAHHYVGLRLLNRGKRFSSRANRHYVGSAPSEHNREQLARISLVIDYQQMQAVQ